MCIFFFSFASGTFTQILKQIKLCSTCHVLLQVSNIKRTEMLVCSIFA